MYPFYIAHFTYLPFLFWKYDIQYDYGIRYYIALPKECHVVHVETGPALAEIDMQISFITCYP
jgi:hypothetical protein